MSELATLIETSLGYPLDPDTLADLEAIQARHWAAHDALTKMLEAGILNPDTYLSRLTADLRASMADCLTLLGDARFVRIFGEAGRHPEAMIEAGRATFLKSLRDVQ